MDHDRLFKELLSTFFLDFLRLFVPELAEDIAQASLVPIDKEVFTDVTSGDRHEVDLLVQARLRRQEAFFLIHVETQAKVQADFPARMFKYFARLRERHSLPVYPIAVFSYERPRRVARRPSRSRSRASTCCASDSEASHSIGCAGETSKRRKTRWPARS